MSHNGHCRRRGRSTFDHQLFQLGKAHREKLMHRKRAGVVAGRFGWKRSLLSGVGVIHYYYYDDDDDYHYYYLYLHL